MTTATEFDLTGFKKFSTSTEVDGNYVGTHGNCIARVVRQNIDSYREIVESEVDIPGLVGSQVMHRDNDLLVLEHDRLEFITLREEWTRKQRYQAALHIVDVQLAAMEQGFYLRDPHSFNITFDQADPVYFDIGSLVKGIVDPQEWILKNFLGRKESKDYWRDVLEIDVLSYFAIRTQIKLSSNPYETLVQFLEQRMAKFEKKAVTNWTGYSQQDPDALVMDERTQSFKRVLDSYSPSLILDIGANKGAFSKYALNNGVERALCADIDEDSLNILRLDIQRNQLPICTAKLDLMNYSQAPGCFGSYQPIHDRWNSDFAICFAVTHHLCYFADYSFEAFSNTIEKFCKKTLLVEFIPHSDLHLSGAEYRGKDRSWYTLENFIRAMKKHFPGDHEVMGSSPSPRQLVLFNK